MISRYRTASIAVVSTALLSYTHIAQADSSGFTDHCSGAAGKYDAPLRGWYWTWENDVAGVVKSDSYYTQGAQVGYTFRKHAKPNVLDRVASPLCKLLGFDTDGDAVLSANSLFLGQQLFTPKDKSSPLPNADDRPYAGWAYLGARLELLQPLTLSNEGRRRWHTHAFEIQAGVVGSNAIGEQTQRAFHDMDGSVQSNGWDNQISNRYAGQAFYNFSTRLTAYDIGGLSSDILWDVGGAAGSLQNHISTGATWRIGRNMGPMAQRAIQPSSITASLHPANKTSTATERDTRKCEFLLHAQECYFFVGANAKGVNKNIFLEGASSGAGSEISAEEFVYELTWGFRARYRWARFDYVSTIRSREFSPAPANPLDLKGRHDFGSLTMSCYGGFGGYNGKLEVICPGFVAAVASFLVFRD